MTTTEKMRIATSSKSQFLPRLFGFGALFVWHQAWLEYQRIQRLDGDALQDMGISETERKAITITQIAARLRAHH